MKSVNKVTLLGNLGQDPDYRVSQGGKGVCRLRVATTSSWKDKENQWHDDTEWHNVVLFGPVAERAKEYLQKGSLVYLEGSLRTSKWQDKSGNDRYSTEVIARDFKNCSHAEERSGPSVDAPRGATPTAVTQDTGLPDADALDDDIPF